MPDFNNLPGVFVRKDDGNLMVLETVPGNVTLILGTAPDGPVDSFYFVRDSVDAEAIFDPRGTKYGTLLRGMHEALQAGAQYLGLFRIGAKPAKLDFLNGFTILTRDANTSVGEMYKVFYSFSAETGHELKVFSALTDELIYDNLSGFDAGIVSVNYSGALTNSTVTVGSTDGTNYTGVLLSSVDTAIGGGIVAAVDNTLTFGVADGTKAGHNYVTVENTQLSIDHFLPGSVLRISGAQDDLNGDYIVSHKVNNTIYLSHKLLVTLTDSTWVPFYGFTEVTPGNAFTVGVTLGLRTRYVPSSLGLNMTFMEKYEALEKAYWALEAAKVDMVIPKGVYLDTPNIVLPTSNSVNLNIGSVEPDFLGKAYKFEVNSEIFFMWDINNDGIAEIVPTPYEVGLDGYQAHKLLTGRYTIESILNDDIFPESDITFNEANFGHQLAEYLYGLSVNDNEAHGVIPMMEPKGYSKVDVARWVGKEPTYDINGRIVASGSGLLGYKFMAGALTVNKGFFHTSNGFVDGTAVIDRKQMKIDIGQYLSVTAMPLIVYNSYINAASGYISSASAIYGGFDMYLDAKEAATNKKVRGSFGLPLVLPKKTLDPLVAYGYVVFTSSADGGVKVVDAPTAALPTSDYKRRLTTKIVSKTIEYLRSLADPFIGNIINGEIRNALEEQMNSSITQLQGLGYLNAGLAKVRATREMEIRGEALMELTLMVPGELRRLIVYVSLSK